MVAQYKIVGNVVIGTDEYRHLIEQRKDFEKEYLEYRDKYINERNRADKFEKKINTLTKKLKTYKDLLKM